MVNIVLDEVGLTVGQGEYSSDARQENEEK